MAIIAPPAQLPLFESKACPGCKRLFAVASICASGCCRECSRERDKRYRANNREKVLERKRLNHQRNAEVEREKHKQWRKENAEKVREYKRKYHTENAERLNERRRQRRKENPERWREEDKRNYDRNAEQKRERAKRYRKANIERLREYYKRWAQENAERLAEYKKRWAKESERPETRRNIDVARRARERNAEGTFTFEEWQELCERYLWKCICCHKELPLTVDHVIPLSKGGSNYIDNIQPLCRSCNSRKGTKALDFRKYNSPVGDGPPMMPPMGGMVA